MKSKDPFAWASTVSQSEGIHQAVAGIQEDQITAGATGGLDVENTTTSSLVRTTEMRSYYGRKVLALVTSTVSHEAAARSTYCQRVLPRAGPPQRPGSGPATTSACECGTNMHPQADTSRA